MDKKELRIVFMGTPEFAVESLKELVENGYPIVGVVTMPDKPAGRGHKIQFSPVKEYALSKNLPLLQPEKLKSEDFLNALRGWNADLQIVVAFRMLPEAVWNMPRLGTFNLHASLLPQYRGAAPINWAVINGETETGATTFFLTHEIDTGKVIMQERIAIDESDNAGTIHDRLMTMGAQMVTQTVDRILEGTAETTEQEVMAKGVTLKPAPKIFKETCRIDWNRPARDIHNLVRGLSPYPASWSELQTTDGTLHPVKIYRTACLSEPTGTVPAGTVRCDNKKYIDVACADEWLRIETLQLAGRKRLNADELLRGFSLSGGCFVSK